MEPTFDGIRSLIVKERYLTTCPKAMELFLRERSVHDLEELGNLAEQYEDAHGQRPRSECEGRVEFSRKPWYHRRLKPAIGPNPVGMCHHGGQLVLFVGKGTYSKELFPEETAYRSHGSGH